MPTFDTIILLTGPVDETVLAAVLRRHNPALNVRSVKSLAELEAIERGELRRARLVAFVTPVIVPPRILKALGYGAYNFHPGPPHYPGYVPSHFAVYERATEFGATAHVMVEKVDAGPIIGVSLFKVPPKIDVVQLETLTFSEIARLFWQLAPQLTTQAAPLPELPIKWRGRKSTRRLYAQMCEIPDGVTKQELDRRIEVFGAGHLGLHPTLTLHGYRFRLEAPETPAPVPASAPAEAPLAAAS